MKKLLAIIFVLALAVPSYAAYTGPAGKQPGFKGPAATTEASTVAEALKLADDARVILTGNIVSQLSKDEYTFKDATGEIIIEVNPKTFRALGVDVTPETQVRIFGKMDKDFAQKPEIEVKHIEIIK